jgi:hypothetical protein
LIVVRGRVLTVAAVKRKGVAVIVAGFPLERQTVVELNYFKYFFLEKQHFSK